MQLPTSFFYSLDNDHAVCHKFTRKNGTSECLLVTVAAIPEAKPFRVMLEISKELFFRRNLEDRLGPRLPEGPSRGNKRSSASCAPTALPATIIMPSPVKGKSLRNASVFNNEATCIREQMNR